MNMKVIITVNAMKDKSGMVTNPKYSMNFVVHETPVVHGASVSGMIL